MIKRSYARHAFIESLGYQSKDLTFLASDMSPRQYFRLKTPRHSFVLMDTPESPQQFIQVAHYLKNCGIRAPEIIAQDLDQGFVLLEDFGDQRLTLVRDQSPEIVATHYLTAIQLLQHLHLKATEKPAFIEPYTPHKLAQELSVFIEWYPSFKTAPSEAAADEFLMMWETIFNTLPQTPQSLVLRDYHIDNLMILDNCHTINSCGVLDFQDALWGSILYDVVSLIQDARCDISPDLTETLWQAFLKPFPEDSHADYRTVGTVLGAARHLRVIGVFTRYALKQGNSRYLCHLPRLWRYLDTAFKDSSPLIPISTWLKKHMG